MRKSTNAAVWILTAAVFILAIYVLLCNRIGPTTEHDKTLLSVQLTLSCIGCYCICMWQSKIYRIVKYSILYVSAVIIVSTAIFCIYEEDIKETVNPENVEYIKVYGKRIDNSENIAAIIYEFNELKHIRRKPKEWDMPSEVICLSIVLNNGNSISITNHNGIIEVHVKKDAEMVYLGKNNRLLTLLDSFRE